MSVSVVTIVPGALGTVPSGKGVKEARRVGNRGTNRNRPNYSIVKMDQNTEKSHRDLRKLAITQTPLKEH